MEASKSESKNKWTAEVTVNQDTYATKKAKAINRI